MHDSTIIQRALLTVFDKTGIVQLAEHLHLKGIEIISTGNTAELLKGHGLPVISVNEYTGFPEMMGGRVKTLHPKIHGGILGRRDLDNEIMTANAIPDIDLVVVNLYPFQQVIQNPHVTLEDAIENIDIGGPTLLRGAAKNHQWCTVLVDPRDYDAFITELDDNHGFIKDSSRFYYATKAFNHTATYDTAIADFLNKKLPSHTDSEFSPTLTLRCPLKETLRYGENPHQKAAFYQEEHPPQDSITNATQHQGKTLSFNNITDSDTALECVKRLDTHGCVIVKHANPCGVAQSGSLIEAYNKAYACDPTSAFGGIIAFNSEVDETLIEHILKQQFVEVLIAPAFTNNALEVAKAKPNCRLLQYHPLAKNIIAPRLYTDLKSVNGGVLIQTWNDNTPHAFTVATRHQPTDSQMTDLRFAWEVVKYVKSNGIVYAKDAQTLGIGAGQMSRVFSTEIAAIKAKQQHLDLNGAVMASDAFFPFKDNIEKAYEYGIRAIIQPGGSVRDEEVIACANDLGISMVFTHIRYFRH